MAEYVVRSAPLSSLKYARAIEEPEKHGSGKRQEAFIEWNDLHLRGCTRLL